MGKENKHLPPLLLTSHGEQSEKQSIYNFLEDRYHTMCLPILCNKSVLCSAYGWLVLLDQTGGDLRGDCCLWNPTSMDIIQLPSLKDPVPFIKCILSNPPTEPDCFVVFDDYPSFVQIVCRIADGTVFEVDAEEKDYRVVAKVSFQGLIYGIIQPRFEFEYYEFVTIHMVGDTLDARPLLIDGERRWRVPQPTRSWVTENVNFLIESPCGNELLLVTKMLFNIYLESGVHFRVYRVDVARMECQELDNLDGRTIFISSLGNGFCRSSESFGTTIKPNSIYYTNENGMVVYVYDLDDMSTTTLLPRSDPDIDPNTSKNYWVDISETSLIL